MPQYFQGKTVFVTGASSGIGAAVAQEFARQGALVSLAARRQDRLKDVQRQIEQLGGRALAVACDVTQRQTIDAAVSETVRAFGELDVAVANAGFGVKGGFVKLHTEDFRRQFETNFFGVLNTIYAVLPHLIASKGRLVIVSSLIGRVGYPRTSAYCASKFALCGLAESIHYELAPKGVSVTCINPGLVESEFRSVDNEGILHPEWGDTSPWWLRVPADKAAHAIVRAIHRRKFEAVITGHAKIIAFASRHFPRTLRFVGRRLMQSKVRLP